MYLLKIGTAWIQMILAFMIPLSQFLIPVEQRPLLQKLTVKVMNHLI